MSVGGKPEVVVTVALSEIVPPDPNVNGADACVVTLVAGRLTWVLSAGSKQEPVTGALLLSPSYLAEKRYVPGAVGMN
jgi:hypothetical protein